MCVQNVPAVQFIPHDSIVKVGRFFHHVLRKAFPGHNLVFLDMAFSSYFIMVDTEKMGDDHIAGAMLCRGYHHPRGIRGDPVITVHKLQVFPLCLVHCQIAGVGYPGLLLADYFDPGVLLCVLTAYCQTPVITSVIYQKYLQFPVILL